MKLIKTYSADGTPCGFIRIPDAAICTVDIESVPEPAAAHVLTLRVGLRNGPLSASVSPYFDTEAEAMTELDRIAALISGEAAPVPSFGWVPGPPPLDGQHYLVRVTGDPGLPFDVATKRRTTGYAESYESGCTLYYAEAITHHNPTPISLEIP
jgi:hypothetical protein